LNEKEKNGVMSKNESYFEPNNQEQIIQNLTLKFKKSMNLKIEFLHL